MPVHKIKLPDGSTGYQWGNTGKIYKDPRKAYAQGAAIEHSGWKQKKAAISQPTISNWYMRGICKVAGLRKQAYWPWGSTAPKQGAPATTPGKPGFLGSFGNTFSNIGNKIKNIGTNLANLGEADHAWGALDYAVDFFRNPGGLRDNTMDQDTGLTFGQKKQIATGHGSLLQGSSQYDDGYRKSLIRDTRMRNAVRKDINNTISGFKSQQPAPAPQPAQAPAVPSTQALQPAAPTGATAQQAPAPSAQAPGTAPQPAQAPQPAAPAVRPAVQTTRTADQHADNIAKGKGNIMVNGQVDMVRDDYEQQLRRINNAIAGIQNGEPNNDAIAATGGAMSPTLKTMDPDTYQAATDPNSPETQAYLAKLRAQKAQIQNNIGRLGMSAEQRQAAKDDGSAAAKRKAYAQMVNESKKYVKSQAPLQSHNKQMQGKKPVSTRTRVSEVYDTTQATNNHASYTRNGITYLQFNNAAEAQKALGTNNVMAMTRGKGDNKKLYWAPVSAKGNKPVGSYASTPGAANSTLTKSPNIVRPYGMRGNKNGWKSAT